MTKPFPAALAEGIDEPSRFDIEVNDLEVIEGEVPPNIDGLFVQAVPDQMYPPEVEPLWPMTVAAGGDGAVRAFRIKDGCVDFRTRHVRTQRYLLEHAARRSLFGNYRDPFTDDPSVAGKDRTTANTSVYQHAGRLLASKEDGLPYEVDQVTLQTKGVWNPGGKIASKTFTAHPKWDPANGEMHGFGYAARGETTRDVAYYVFDAKGELVHEAWFKAPHAAMIHDCALTEHYMLFPLMPLTTDLERLKAGGQHWVYDPDFPVVIGVVPRNGRGDQVRWFNAPHAFTGHTINAFEEDGRIVFDTYECDGNGFAAVMPDKHGRMSDPTKVTTRAVRWRIDYHAASPVLTDRQVLFVADGEGPHIDPRRMCRSYRHVFAPTLNRSRLITDRNGRVVPVFFNQLTHFDLATGRREDWYAGEGATLQDPVYFPRSATAEEDDGYLIVVLNRPLEKSNELVILQSRRLGAGPVARLRLPVRLRLGIHSNWIDGSLVPSWR